MRINAKGSYEAGIKFCEICFGYLSTVQLGTWEIDDVHSFSAVEVYVSDLNHSVLWSQLAGWSLEKGPFAAIGSGPARVKAQLPTDPYMKNVDYVENHHEAVLCIQGIHMPTDEMAMQMHIYQKLRRLMEE